MFSAVLCTTVVHSYKHTHEQFLRVYFTAGLGLDISFLGFLCVFVFYLARASLFILCFCCIFSCLFCIVSTSASDCLQRLVSKMTYYV